MVKIAVIGAGVNGLSCALKIKKQYPNYKVTVISDKFSPETTGDGSGGLWYPYLSGKTPEKQISKWGCETYRFLHQLWLEGNHNVCLVPVYVLRNDKMPRPEWADTVFGYQDLNENQLKFLNTNTNHTSGHTFTTFISTAPSLLAYLQKSYISLNGEMRKRKIASLRDPMLDEYDVIINCTGLGARYLVPDEAVFPIRGQIIKVHAPWIGHAILSERGSYILPNAENCVLGGTSQEHNWNTNEDPKDTEHILKECWNLIPGLKHATIQQHWTGLRPGRDEIRLECEERNGKIYIHNYGHGGSGLTLFWGCASDVLYLLETHLSKIQSKL